MLHNVLYLILQLMKSDMSGSPNSVSECSVGQIKVPISR